MIKLIFPLNPTGDLELTLATARYEHFWQAHHVEILSAFEHHTSFKFKQRQITVKATEKRISWAGDRYHPMELTRHRTDEELIGINLIHELAHRLLSGNYIKYQDSNNYVYPEDYYVYHEHCYIDLFLHDVWTDVLGKEAADRALEAERNNGYPPYRKAWDWAMSKTYVERQKYLCKLIKSRTPS